MAGRPLMERVYLMPASFSRASSGSMLSTPGGRGRGGQGRAGRGGGAAVGGQGSMRAMRGKLDGGAGKQWQPRCAQSVKPAGPSCQLNE